MTVPQALLAPLFLHVLMIFWLGRTMLRARIGAVKGGEARLKEIAVNSAAWPDHVRKLGNNFDSQFDLPVLWYAVCALLLVTSLADWVAVVLSWAFFAARIVHSYIHTGSNTVPLRLGAFLAGFFVLIAMWLWFAIRLYVIG